MAEVRYPAWEKRIALLRCVHEWIEERDAADDLRAIVDGEVLERWASTIEGMSNTEAKYILKQLVDEYYVTCVHMPTERSYEPFVYVVPQSLTEKGLLTIGEMPDPSERLIRGFEAAISQIERDPEIPPEEKRRKIAAGYQAIEFVRDLGVAIAAKILMG